jgi:hypothetical protein
LVGVYVEERSSPACPTVELNGGGVWESPLRGSEMGYAATSEHFSRSSLQDYDWRREEAFKGTYIMKFLSLGFVLAAITFAPGCISYSSTTRTAPAPAPAPPPEVQRTVYSDGTYVDQPVQPAPR